MNIQKLNKKDWKGTPLPVSYTSEYYYDISVDKEEEGFDIPIKKKKFEKINYLYEEIYPNDKKCIEERYKILINDIETNYSDYHNDIYKILRLTKKKTRSN